MGSFLRKNGLPPEEFGAVHHARQRLATGRTVAMSGRTIFSRPPAVTPEGARSSLLLFPFEALQARLQVFDGALLALDDLCEYGGDVHR